MINIQDLSFRFQGSERFALRGVNLAISPGEFLVVVGPSGCGKSTLALAIGGYLFRQYDGEAQGRVMVNGLDARHSPIYDVAQVVGLVQQNPEAQFCTLTVRDEVAFGLENRRLPRSKIEERLEWALGIVGAEHLAARSLATLSGGEKQKVAIAAMMAAKPEVLIFDEPTSNLDPTATRDIFEVIARIRAKSGIAVIVIEHKVDYLMSFRPRLVTMEEGRITYDGPMDGVYRQPQVGPCRPRLYPENGFCGEIPCTPLLRVEGLQAGYNGHRVLQDVSVRIDPGEFVAVMGDNGSGKTTFLHSLLGLLKPDQGQVCVLGQDTRDTPVSHLARQVGFVFQNPDHQLFADGVWEEATFAPRNLSLLDEGTSDRVADLLARSGLGDRHADHPYRLSYGQKRRLNLISVLSYAPRLILLDEVLIGQDPANAGFLLDLLRDRVEQGDAVVMVNHAPHITYRYATRLLFFHKGRLVIDAPVDEGFERLTALGQQAYSLAVNAAAAGEVPA
jgi:energy-coupling factor transport system ATP-binding protein